MKVFLKSLWVLGVVFVVWSLPVLPVGAGTIYDNFDDNVTNTKLWGPFVNYDLEPGHGVSIAETEGKLQVTVDLDHTEGYYAGYTAKFDLIGDFDAQVDYYHLNPRPAPPSYPYWFGTRIGFSFSLGTGKWANLHYLEYWDAPQVMFGVHADKDCNGEHASDNYWHGRLRMVRTGNRLEGFDWDWTNNVWNSVGLCESAGLSVPIKIGFMVWDGAVHTNGVPTALLALSNFRVSSPSLPTVVVPLSILLLE